MIHQKAVIGLRGWARLLVALMLFTGNQGCAFLLRYPAVKVSRTEPKEAVFRGVYHVHSRYSHDSKASLKTIYRTARKAGKDFVIITDHNNRRAESELAQPGFSMPPLLILGEEISTADGHLIALGIREEIPPGIPGGDAIDRIHRLGGFAFLAHPFCSKNPWKNWDIRNYDGIEVYDFSHSFYDANKWAFAFKAFLPPGLFLKAYLPGRAPDTEPWDRLLKGRKVHGIASADAHVHVQFLGLNFESLLLQFQAVSIYVYASELETKSVLEAIGSGKTFFAFDVYGDAAGFRFEAVRGGEKWVFGESLRGSGPVKYKVILPSPGEIRVIHNGEMIHKIQGIEFEFETAQKGYFRVEVYKKGKPWIISNPIYAYSE